ncbi:MAG: nitroreductase [Clostridiales bacterium]|nr:nitroreductase [Clostridiales bacterium]
MDVMDAIKARHSVRQYSSREVEPEKLEKVLEAGRLAPSASNEQNWKFIAVSDPGLRKQLMQACKGQAFVGDAPVDLVICANNERNMMCGQPARTIDCSIALSFMMLEACELGLGTCWLGWFEPEEVRKVLNIPKDYAIVAISPLGYPAKDVNAQPRKPAKDIIVHDCM